MKQYEIKVNGKKYDVVVNGVDQTGKADVIVNGQKRVVEIGGMASQVSASVAANSSAQVSGSSPLAVKDVPVQTASPSGNGMDVVSPLPGVILSIKVNVGDRVSAGQSVAVLEAMKMENEIEAEKAGTVKAIFVQKGDSVLEGAKIVTIE